MKIVVLGVQVEMPPAEVLAMLVACRKIHVSPEEFARRAVRCAYRKMASEPSRRRHAAPR